MRSLLVVGSLFALAACGSGGDDSEAPAATTETSVTTTSPDGPAATSSLAPAPTAALDTVSPTTTPTPTTATPTTVASTTTPTTTSEVSLRPTISSLLTWGGVLNIAHAGGDQEWPHSTFYAFDQAVAAGADVLEMDVQLSADGVLVVVHDETVDGTTEATGRVDELTFEQLSALDAAHWYVPGCWPCRELDDDAYVLRGVRTGDRPAPDGVDPETLRIVSFAEVVERYPRKPFDVEIKGTGEAARAAADALVEIVEEYGLTEHVVVVSFDDPTIDHVRSIAPDVEVSPGVATLSRWLLDGEPLDPDFRIVQVPPEFAGQQVLSPEFWDAARDAGVAVWVWPNDASTQENAEFYAELVAQGASGVIAGRPSEMP